MLKKTHQIKNLCYKIRKTILDVSYNCGEPSHIGGALSIVEIVSVLFSDVMNLNKENPLWEERDRFILSKGHACLAYYAALCEIGHIPKSELKTFEKNETINCFKVDFLEIGDAYIYLVFYVIRPNTFILHWIS